MGLDIRAHQFATLIDDHTPPNAWCPDQDEEGYDHDQAYVYAPFARSAAGLELLDEREGELVRYGRCYRLHGESHWFRAGSYSGYGIGREQVKEAALEMVAGPASFGVVDAGDDEPPFTLWTRFADNEGWIGPKAAEILAGEFDAHGARLREAMGDGWTEWLDDWEAAFRLAAGGGAVVFT